MKYIFIVAALVLAGCASPPKTNIKIGDITISGAKDTHIENFKAKIDPKTGIINVEFSSWLATNSPQVISANGAAVVQQINATANLASKVSAATAQAMLAQQGIKPVSTTTNEPPTEP